MHAYTMTTKQKPQTARKFVFNQLVVGGRDASPIPISLIRVFMEQTVSSRPHFAERLDLLARRGISLVA